MQKHLLSATLYERTVNTMFGTVAVLALMYCVVLLSLVFSVIERKQNTVAVRDLTSEVGSLETRYANQVTAINDSTLANNHYSRVDGTTLAVRKDSIASYSVLYAH